MSRKGNTISRRDVVTGKNLLVIRNCIRTASQYSMECEVIETAIEQILCDPKKYVDNNKLVKWKNVAQAFADACYEWDV